MASSRSQANPLAIANIKPPILELQTYQPDPGGMNRASAQSTIPDSTCWTLFDAMLNVPGYMNRRGPVQAQSADSISGAHATGLVVTQDPGGTDQAAMLANVGGAGKLVQIVNGSYSVNPSWPYAPATSPYEVFDAKDALSGGQMIGTAPTYSNPSQSGLALWRGAAKADVAATSLSSAIAVGATTVSVETGHGVNFCPGHFIFNNSGQLVGVVTKVTGDVLNLEFPALVSEAATITAQVLRGLNPRVTTGVITTASGSATVNGGGTKFAQQGLASGTWDVFTTDFTFIGTVSAVASDAQLTLTGNAAVSVVAADYVAIQRNGSYSILNNELGFLNCSFAGHQFYGLNNKLRWSDTTDQEGVDLTPTGNELEFSADPIRAILPTLSSLIVLTENDCYALTGAIGTTPDRWRGSRAFDDGTICGMSGNVYRGGVLWAGKRGIYFYDGATSVQNIGAALGTDYQTFVQDATRAYSMVCKDTYFVFIEGGASGPFFKEKNGVKTNVTQMTIAIDMVRGTVACHLNVELRGVGQTIPSTIPRGTAMYVVTTNESGTNWARACSADDLFLLAGNDQFACDGGPGAGPDFFLETKKYDMNNAQRLKLFKMMLLNFLAVGGNLMLETVSGLGNNTYLQSGTQFIGISQSDYNAGTADWQDQRIKFMKRNQVLGLRVYQSTILGNPPGTAAATTQVQIGTWAVVYQWMRPGRV